MKKNSIVQEKIQKISFLSFFLERGMLLIRKNRDTKRIVIFLSYLWHNGCNTDKRKDIKRILGIYFSDRKNNPYRTTGMKALESCSRLIKVKKGV